MDEEPEGWDKELYEKLSFEYLVTCGENGRIDEWNALYLEYLESEWKRVFPEREWDPKNIPEFVYPYSSFKNPDFSGKNCLEVVSHVGMFAGAHLEGVDFSGAHLWGADFTEAHMEGALLMTADLSRAYLRGAHMEEAFLMGTQFWKAHLEGAHMERALIGTTDFKGANLQGAHFEGVDFSWADCKRVNFSGACMEGLNFGRAHLEGAYFNRAHLERTNFSRAYLRGAYFSRAHLEGAEFTYALVDEETIFIENHIDKNTDFTGTALSATRIDPVLRTKLERNIREIHWRKWYDKPKISPLRFMKELTGKIDETEMDAKENERHPSLIDRIFINPFVQLFWWLSNYGTSCKRCLASFAGLIVLAFIVNLILTQSTSPDIAELFADTVLALFGVGDPGLMGIARLWQVVYVVSGYFLLAVLISRFAIMFQNMSP